MAGTGRIRSVVDRRLKLEHANDSPALVLERVVVLEGDVPGFVDGEFRVFLAEEPLAVFVGFQTFARFVEQLDLEVSGEYVAVERDRGNGQTILL